MTVFFSYIAVSFQEGLKTCILFYIIVAFCFLIISLSFKYSFVKKLEYNGSNLIIYWHLCKKKEVKNIRIKKKKWNISINSLNLLYVSNTRELNDFIDYVLENIDKE
jgi:hypothetical protein